MNIFDPDNKLIQALQSIGGLILLNLCYILCCLPVITFGAATAALYTVTLQEARDHSGSYLGRFFKAFKSNFGKATILWAILLVAGAMLVYVYFFFTANPDFSTPVFSGMLIALCIVYVLVITYVFPLQARYENTVFRTLRNSLAFAIGNLPRTLVMGVLNVLPLAVLAYDEKLFWQLSIFLVMIYFAGIAFLNSKMLMKIFTKAEARAENG